MASRCRTVTIVLGAAALAGFGWAEEPAADPVLEALVAEALERNPELVALRESLQGARERPAQARALPDPMLSVLYTNDGWSPSLGERDMTTLAFMASQALPRRGVRGLRAAIAEREVDLAEQQLERARLSVAADVKRAYYALALSRERLELVREQERIWRQIEGVARARYPNLGLIYLASRTYAGYASTNLNPEPYAYEGGFSMRWLIERQQAGAAGLNADPERGPVDPRFGGGH